MASTPKYDCFSVYKTTYNLFYKTFTSKRLHIKVPKGCQYRQFVINWHWQDKTMRRALYTDHYCKIVHGDLQNFAGMLLVAVWHVKNEKSGKLLMGRIDNLNRMAIIKTLDRKPIQPSRLGLGYDIDESRRRSSCTTLLVHRFYLFLAISTHYLQTYWQWNNNVEKHFHMVKTKLTWLRD